MQNICPDNAKQNEPKRNAHNDARAGVSLRQALFMQVLFVGCQGRMVGHKIAYLTSASLVAWKLVIFG